MSRCEAKWQPWFGGGQCEFDAIEQDDFPGLVLCSIHLNNKKEEQDEK